MKKILCPTDFSEVSINAAHYAAELAKEAGSELIIMHALHVPIPDANTPVDLSAEVMADQKEAIGRKLKEVCEMISSQHGIKVTDHIEYGLAATLIGKVAENVFAEAVVMGTKGADNLLDKLFGSITSEVLGRTNCPVIAVPEGAKFKGLKKIMYATDLSSDDSGELERFSAFTDKFKPEIHVVHVEKDDSVDISDDDPLLKRTVEEKEGLKHVEIRNINVEDALFKYAEFENIDMLALKKHRLNVLERLFHVSVSRKMSLHSTIPLMIFNEK